MPRKKQETGSNGLGLPLPLEKSATTWSVSMATKLGDLTTMLQSSTTQIANTAFHVTQENGKNVARLAIAFEIPGDLETFISGLWKLNLPVTSPGISQKK